MSLSHILIPADRRPIDPPPIVQLRVIDPSQRRPQSGDSRSSSPDGAAASLASQSFLQNPYYFMFASLAKPDEDVELHWLKDGKTRCTTGSVVSSLYHLKDAEAGGEDAGFFVFPDLSVRTEGSYRLKLSLFEVVGSNVYHCKSIFSAPFYVYTAKKFPGMEESTPLSCSLADQGIKIRIRKDIRVRKRPIQALGDAPVPLPMPGPPPGGAFGPVPVRLDDPEPEEEREKEEEMAREVDVRESSRDYEHRRDDERERESPWEEPRRVSGRRDSGAGPSAEAGGRRESMGERSAKRARADDGNIGINTSGGIPEGTDASPASAGPSSAGWGPIDPTLAPSQQAQPSVQVSQAQTTMAEHHYAPAPSPVAASGAVSYDRYAAAPIQASAPAQAQAPPPYHYDSAHAPQPTHHYGAPPPMHHYSHVPPPVHHPVSGYPYPPTQGPGQGPWYESYAHHYSMPPPSSHHPHAHHAPPPPPRYGEYPGYAQGYAYYEHAPPPPSQPGPPQHHQQHPGQHHMPPPPPSAQHAHHSYQHSGYAPVPTPPSPSAATASATVQYEYAAPSGGGSPTDTRSQVQGSAGSVHASRSYGAPQYASAPPPTSGPGQSPTAQHHYGGQAPQSAYASQYPAAPPQSQVQSASQGHASGSGGGGGSRGQYQLSTPPHVHQTPGFNVYPPAPNTGGASMSSPVNASTGGPPSAGGNAGGSGESAWGYAPAASAWGVGPGAMVQGDPYPYESHPGRIHNGIRLAPLRVGQGSPPPGSGERAVPGKKNPLSIGNIISDDTR
ncbi:uncharacterized protein FIBRA_06256 [Fibroporia radiculosa]|uniref:Velvet domain-containing protein n=1 Tax=Fibroporia radiculosa TaxID=599839 RepID=J4HYU1_9APHY|nr:uncharacterized protein FIBRA_06256 [Fibroporia radiculosa]CCM04097.1 predicted protein [Fibroporia radiculosa]